MSAPKAGAKALKRKNDAKNDRPPKKRTSPSVGDKQQKSSSPPPPRYGIEKGLMTVKGPVSLNPVQRLVMHKDYAIEMINSINKETDLDPYGEHFLEDLGASDLYDLSRVCFLSLIVL